MAEMIARGTRRAAGGMRPASRMATRTPRRPRAVPTFREYLTNSENSPKTGLGLVLHTVSEACVEIQREVDLAPIRAAAMAQAGKGSTGTSSSSSSSRNASGDEQKELDLVANEILISRLRECPSVAIGASEENDEIIQMSEGEVIKSPITTLHHPPYPLDVLTSLSLSLCGSRDGGGGGEVIRRSLRPAGWQPQRGVQHSSRIDLRCIRTRRGVGSS